MGRYPVYTDKFPEPMESPSYKIEEKNIQEQPVVEATPNIIEKREGNLKDYLNALVNGDEISQLFISNELTEKAKEELIKLQEEAANSAKINMNNLREEIKDLEKRLKELEEENQKLLDEKSRLELEKHSLNEEVEALKKRKLLLTQAMISDLSLMKQAVQDEFTITSSANCDWEWDIREWKRITDEVCWADYSISRIPSLFEEKFKEYAEKMKCTEEEAKKVFYEVCPGVKYVLDFIGNIKDPTTLERTFRSARNSNSKLNNNYCAIYLPIYELVKKKSKML